ncbi:MAG TPA: ABC transporter ATP-binding protein [Aeromicrobium sp.]|nr:ABC transporter ATP-binding protein [Aeromicrobium sp.]
MTDIEFRNITLDLPDGTRALDDVSLEVPSGTRLALCGPARAGKTTLLRILVGLEDATEGDVLLNGVVASRMSPRDRNLSMVFSDYLLHPHLDTYDNMAFAAHLRREQAESEIDALVEEVAELLALTPVLDERPSALDDAHRQRTALGRSLVREADGYLFDEAFSAQEPRIRGHVRSVTAQWQADLDRTCIYATNHPEEAATLAERVAIMNLGWVHQVGSPREIYEHPADLFVAGFMGSPVMNLVPAEVDGSRLELPFGSMRLNSDQAERVGDRKLVVVGVRPEHCFDAAKAESYRLRRPVEFEANVDDVEWGGKTQSVYLGYELQPGVEEQLTAIEDDFEFDLFQNFFVAQLSTDSPTEIGSTIRVAVSSEAVHLFDLETAEAL